jgi:hypothetical protein
MSRIGTAAVERNDREQRLVVSIAEMQIAVDASPPLQGRAPEDVDEESSSAAGSNSVPIARARNAGPERWR